MAQTWQWHNGWSYRKQPEVRTEMDWSYLSDTENMEMAPRLKSEWRWRWHMAMAGRMEARMPIRHDGRSSGSQNGDGWVIPVGHGDGTTFWRRHDVAMAGTGRIGSEGGQYGMTWRWHSTSEVRTEMDGSYLLDTEMATTVTNEAGWNRI